MTVFIFDAKHALEDDGGQTFAEELLYADDTLLILRTKEAFETLLHEIQRESEYYGLRLNLGKCELLEMNGSQEINFRSGENEEG